LNGSVEALPSPTAEVQNFVRPEPDGRAILVESRLLNLEHDQLRRGVGNVVDDRESREQSTIRFRVDEVEDPELPPFTREAAMQKVRGPEDGWDSRDPERVSLAYSSDSVWWNRAEFVSGRPEIVEFLTRKWDREFEYRLIKELWAFDENRIAVRFAYEWQRDSRSWFRSYGNEN